MALKIFLESNVGGLILIIILIECFKDILSRKHWKVKTRKVRKLLTISQVILGVIFVITMIITNLN